MTEQVSDVQQEAEQENLAPASRVAVTVARAMAERGDDVGPNVTLVLLATIASRDQRIREQEAELTAVYDWMGGAGHMAADHSMQDYAARMSDLDRGGTV